MGTRCNHDSSSDVDPSITSVRDVNLDEWRTNPGAGATYYGCKVDLIYKCSIQLLRCSLRFSPCETENELECSTSAIVPITRCPPSSGEATPHIFHKVGSRKFPSL